MQAFASLALVYAHAINILVSVVWLFSFLCCSWLELF